jgi:hypothetical protein
MLLTADAVSPRSRLEQWRCNAEWFLTQCCCRPAAVLCYAVLLLCPVGQVLSAGELLTALEAAPLDTIYLDAAGQEKGEWRACLSNIMNAHGSIFGI